MENNRQSVQQLKNSMDVQVNTMENISVQFYGFSEFTLEYLSNNSTNYINLMNKISVFKNTNDFLYQIYVYFSGSDKMLSAYGVHNMNVLTEYNMVYPDWPKEKFIQDINNINAPYWRGMEDVIIDKAENKKLLTYLRPINHGSYKRLVIMFQLDTRMFDRYAETLFSYSEANYIIADKSGHVIYDSGNQAYNNESFLEQIKKQKTNTGDFKIESEGKECIVFYSISEDTGFYYISVLPYNIVLSEITSARNIFIIGILLIISIEFIIIAVFMRLNYNPLRQLSIFVRKTFTEVPDTANVVEAAKMVISNLSETNRTLLSSNIDSSREAIILKLLKGSFSTVDAFNDEGRHIGFSLTGSVFRVVILGVKAIGHNEEPKNVSFIELLERIMHPDFEVFILDSVLENSFLLTLSSHSDNPKKLDEKLLLVKSRALELFGLDTRIGAGSSCIQLQDISKSYSEAKNALRYCQSRGDDNIIYYSEIQESQTEGYFYPKAEINALYNTILQRNPSRIRFIIDDLLSVEKSGQISLFAASSLCYGIVNTLFCAGDELGKSFSFRREEFLETINSKTSLHSLGELIDIVNKVTEDLIVNMEDNDANCSELINRVIEYIQCNYSDNNLYVQSIANHFGMTTSNLSHQFKKQTGMNISSYIIETRLSKAKELLRTTNFPLKEILKQTGHNDISAFIRKFRQVEGKTPGQYRSLYIGQAIFRQGDEANENKNS